MLINWWVGAHVNQHKMSHNSAKSNEHGFCEAIFSSSPISFVKENAHSDGRKGKTCIKLFNEPQKQIQNQEKDKNMKQLRSRVLLDTDSSEPRSATKQLVRSKSASVLQRQLLFSGSAAAEDKHKTPVKLGALSSSVQRTPNTYFCTSKQPKMRSATSTGKMNILPSNRTPIKGYFNDHILTQATPDCFNTVQVETPCGKAHEIIEDQTVYEGETSNLTVGIRVRPLNMRELNDPKVTSITEINGQHITVNCESVQHTFAYDHCFISYSDSTVPGHADQEVVFKNMVLPLVQNAFEGYNVCLFAYGQTGSGKSYSMMGQEPSQTNSVSLDEGAGIIPRFCQEIFTRSSENVQTKTIVEISYFEIYNEKIHDLLTNVTSGAKRAPLKVREHPVFGPHIVDLSQHCVQSYKDLQTWLKVGNSQRATAATGMNEKSSRSHSIFSIILTQTQADDQPDGKPSNPSRRSKINLVDLAGSERLSQTCASGDRLKEGVSINKSLLTLGKVIACLAENMNNRKRGFVPYRESVLTWLLKESLGGNSRTAMLGTVSPANVHMEETLATLRYACQARTIVNRVRINEDPHEKIIRELKAEVLRLRGVREGYERQLGIFPRRLLDSIEPVANPANNDIKQKEEEIGKLRDQLKKTEEQLAISQMSWLQKLQETEERKNSELKYLRRCGIAIEIDIHEKDKQPCLINLAADPILSGTLLYLLPPGSVRVGRHSGTDSSSRKLDIMLDGPLVRSMHCTIENNHGKLTLLPEMDADTYVNGQVITGKVVLKHGDRLVIGGNHYFKVLNPHEKNKNTQICAQAVDFEFAHQEILRVQEEKLRAELEECKQKAMKELENAKREVELQLGSQKLSYERKIELLGSTLEEQKLALEQINRRKKELELEKELLASEVETNNRIKQIEEKQSDVEVEPYKSNFLEELESLLNETAADAEYALKMKDSVKAIKVGGISLHEMQILVKEATERCREVGINYEFDQQQVIVNKSLQPAVRIRNRDRMKETRWKPMKFLDWVHRLRDYDIEDSIKELSTPEDVWESYEDTEAFEDSLNSSRISINMTPVKRQLSESLQQLSMDASMLGNTLNNQTVDLGKQQESVHNCLSQMESAAKKLRALCAQGNDFHAVTESLNKMQCIIDYLRSTFEDKNVDQPGNESINRSENESTNSVQSVNVTAETTIIEKSNASIVAMSAEPNPKLNASPVKSTLRTNVTRSPKNTNSQKSVRFTDKE